MGKNLIVVGAGASGLVAAITAARLGAKVTLIEKNNKIGKKILATGNGKCNFTNAYMTRECYHGNLALWEAVNASFSTEETLAFFGELGIVPCEKNGYYYPNSEQASSIVSALLYGCQRAGVTIMLDSKVNGIVPKSKGYQVFIENQKPLYADKVIVACGLLASPNLGSDGSLFDAVKELGHGFTKLVPALCGFECKKASFKELAGVRTAGKVSVYVNDNLVATNTGEIQLTAYGISGIPVFQVSREIAYALQRKEAVRVSLDFMPGQSKEQVYTLLKQRLQVFQNQDSLTDFWNGLLNEKLAGEIYKKAGLSKTMKCKELSEESLVKLSEVICDFEVIPMKSKGYENAQVCAGGIRTEEIEIERLESRFCPGIFFAGEILDIDGICGGYNLQWAWASGVVAAQNAMKE